MSKQKPVPLQAIELFEKLCPRLFTIIDQQSGGKPNPVSFGVCSTIAQNIGLKAETCFIYALATWNRYKQIFEFDWDLAEMLSQNVSLNDTLPTGILKNLPFSSIYVKLPKGFITLEEFSNSKESEQIGKEVDGFICTTYIQNGTEILLFQIMFESMDSVNIGFQLMENATLRQSIDALFKNCNDGVYKILNIFLQLVLYLCAENSDVTATENPQTKRKATAKSKRPQSKKPIKEWKVGFRYGQAIRKHKEISQEAESAERTVTGGSKKCTHARKGHFHHYWTGKRGEERKLILKWVSPTIVNGDFENLATIHKVKK